MENKKSNIFVFVFAGSNQREQDVHAVRITEHKNLKLIEHIEKRNQKILTRVAQEDAATHAL